MIQYSNEITKAISLSELGADTVKVTARARARAWRCLVWPLHNTTRALTDFGRPENSYSDNFVATPCSPAKKKHPPFYSESSSRVKSTHFPRVVVDPDPIRLSIYIIFKAQQLKLHPASRQQSHILSSCGSSFRQSLSWLDPSCASNKLLCTIRPGLLPLKLSPYRIGCLTHTWSIKYRQKK